MILADSISFCTTVNAQRARRVVSRDERVTLKIARGRSRRRYRVHWSPTWGLHVYIRLKRADGTTPC